MDSPAQFRTWCQEKGHPVNQCNHALEILGEHPWDQADIDRVCAREEELNQNNNNAGFLLQTGSTDDVCTSLLQDEDAKMDSPEEFTEWCRGKGHTPEDCSRALSILGDHPWSGD